MSMMYSVIMTILFFGVLPYVVGYLWNGVANETGFIFRYLSGFFTILALFQLLSPTMIFFDVPTHVQFMVYTMVLALVFVGILLYTRKTIASTIGKAFRLPKAKVTEVIYVAVFLVLLGIQVYYAIFYDIGDWRSDDYMYVTFSNAAIYDDGFFKTRPVFGSALPALDVGYLRYALCGIYGFYTYATMLTGIGVAAIEHTICCVLFLLMAYGAFYQLSKYLFARDEERENRVVFLIFTALLFLFGMYSHYSLSFRLLGVIWQGKGFLAVVLLPFLIAVYPRLLEGKPDKKDLAYLFMISIALISPTMGGSLVALLVPGFLTVLHFISYCKISIVKPLLVMWFFPLLCGVIYIVGVKLGT